MRDVADGYQGSKSNTNLYSSVDRCDSQIGQDVVKEYCKTELSNATKDKSQREIPFSTDLIGSLSRKVVVHPWLSQEEGRVPYCSNDLTYYDGNYYCNHTEFPTLLLLKSDDMSPSSVLSKLSCWCQRITFLWLYFVYF